MGLFSREKPKAAQPQSQEEPELDPIVRPDGVFMIKLLMEEACPMPEAEEMERVLSAHLGKIEPFGTRDHTASYAAWDYPAQFKDASVPVQLAIHACEPFQAEDIDEMQRSQMWACMEQRDSILSQCRHAVLAHDMLGGGLPMQSRANLLMDFLEALVELYPGCQAVYCINSGKLILAETVRQHSAEGLERYIQYIVNARFFNISGTQDDHVVDTLGLSLLYIEDLQYHFHGMDPNWVVGHAYSLASYLLHGEKPMEDGDSIDGITQGRLDPEVRWPCRYEEALIQPKRPVLDVEMGEYAAGRRG